MTTAVMPAQDALTAAVAAIAECEVPESLVRQMGEGECAFEPCANCLAPVSCLPLNATSGRCGLSR